MPVLVRVSANRRPRPLPKSRTPGASVVGHEHEYVHQDVHEHEDEYVPVIGAPRVPIANADIDLLLTGRARS